MEHKRSGRIQVVSLETASAEASDLLAIEDMEMLDRLGWDAGFWTVVDEAPLERAVALVGHAQGAARTKGWELRHLEGKLDGGKRSAEDAEACARHGGFVYVFGSHYGSKDGPLERKRSFIARVAESELERVAHGKKVRIDLILDKFLLHRVINDALADFGPPILELGEEIEQQFIGSLRKRGSKKGKAWARRLHPGDVPLNIEGTAFRPGGGLLIGLRFPVTKEGAPLIVEIDGVPDLFDGRPNQLRVRGFWILGDAGSGEAPEGVRALELHGAELHVVTGSLDSVNKDSVVVEDFSGAARAHCDHRAAELPRAPARSRPGSHRLPSTVRRSFDSLSTVEGVSVLADGGFAYVTDDDERVELRLAR